MNANDYIRASSVPELPPSLIDSILILTGVEFIVNKMIKINVLVIM